MIKYLVKKKKITLLFFIMALLMGVSSFLGIPRQEAPDVVIKYATVTTIFPGASAQKMEQSVTKIIEQKVKEIEGVKEITSTSMESTSFIVVKAKDESDTLAVWDKLRKNIQDIKEQLPKGAGIPSINDDLASSFIGSYAIVANGKQQLKELNELVASWKEQLRALPGIAKVEVNGIPKQEVHVNLNSSKMAEYNLSWEQVVLAIEGSKERVPTGAIDFNHRNYQFIVQDKDEIDGLKRILITQSTTGVPIYIGDIANVELSYADSQYFAYYNGKPVITISVAGDTGSDVPSMHQRVEDKMQELGKTLPSHAELKPLFAQKHRVDEMFSNLSKEMLFAIASVILICMLGMNLLTAAFVALAIPISVGIGFIFLPSFGVTLNEISIVGLIIVLGILVDDAVVVNDNIERRLQQFDETPLEASVRGTKEVALSIMTATLCTIFAFAPLLFLKGDIGAFIKPIPIVISLTMLASMIMSLTIIPIFREWYETKKAKKQSTKVKHLRSGLLDKQITLLNQYYAKNLIVKAIKSPLIVGLSGLLISTAAYFLILFVPIELFPESERAEITVNVTTPTGTTLKETDRVVNKIADWMKDQPEVASYSYSSGGQAPPLFMNIDADSTGLLSPTTGQLMVKLKSSENLSQKVKDWDAYLKGNFPDAVTTVSLPSSGIAVGKPVSIRISGENMDQLQKLVRQVKGIIINTEGTQNVKDDLGIERYGLELVVNKEAIDHYMVSYTSLTRTLLLASEGITTSQFDTGKNVVNIRLQIDQEIHDPSKLVQQISVTNGLNEQIPLSQLVTMKPDFSLQQIKHFNMARTITIESDTKGRTASEIVTEITSKLNELKVPQGYTWAVGGETSEQDKIFTDLAGLFVVVILLIFLLIAIQFYSMSTPILVMTTVYLAAAGGVIGLFITRVPLGFMSLMGIISLAGIVVRNGIVFIEFIEDARREGIMLHEAIIEAATARFRPILLTSLTAIMGMVPIALIGDVLFRPMAYTIIFGLIFSTILTLFVVPCLYLVVAQWKMKHQQKKENQNLIPSLPPVDQDSVSM